VPARDTDTDSQERVREQGSIRSPNTNPEEPQDTGRTPNPPVAAPPLAPGGPATEVKHEQVGGVSVVVPPPGQARLEWIRRAYAEDRSDDVAQAYGAGAITVKEMSAALVKRMGR